MSRSPVSKRYAQAMLELADETGGAVALRADFDKLATVLRDVPTVVDMLSNPTVAMGTRATLLDDMLGKLGITGNINNLARLLLEKGRFDVALEIHATFSEMLDARSGRVTAEVTSAVALDAAAQGRIQAALAKQLGKDVQLEATQDSALMGGLVIKVGNVVYDASVKNHLDRLREQLLSSHVA